MSMTNYPLTASSSQTLKSHDCRARDIRRRLEVIQKKMSDLQELGVPCAFCYISVRNTGSLFTMGNQAMTQVIEESRDIILEKLSDAQLAERKEEVRGDQKEIHMVLPPLSRPLDELNLHDLRALIVGILKDLGIKWSDKKPPFWPEAIPFQYPRTAPEGLQGCWTKTLREIVRSIYTYFDYNPTVITTPTVPSILRDGTRPPSSAIQNQFFPEQKQRSPLASESQPTDDDEEEEEIDVGMPSTPKWSHDIQHTSHDASYTVPPQSHDLPVSQSSASLQQNNSEEPLDEEDTRSDEMISVCSDQEDEQPLHENSTVNYFGYEIAGSESVHSSPLPTIPQSDRETSPEASASASPVQAHTLLQPPRLLYCDPRLYSQLYPRLQATPLLLHPNLLMKQLLYTSVDDGKGKDGLITSSIKSSLNPPYTLPSSSSPSLQSLATPSYSAVSYQPLSTKEINTSHVESSLNAKLPPASQSEPKNRKGKNGIYIYTTPSEPLKFMSLGEDKHVESNGVGRKRSVARDKKLVAMAPSPQSIGLNRDAVILKDSEYQLHIMTPQINSSLLSLGKQGSSIKTSQTSTNHNPQKSPGLSKPTNGIAGKPTKKPQGSTKRRRELVFHWYQSPEHQPAPSTSPPSTKRMKTASSV